MNGILAYEYIKKKLSFLGGKILAFLDNDIKKQRDKTFIEKYGIPCISPEKFVYDEKILIINAVKGKKEEIFSECSKNWGGGRDILYNIRGLYSMFCY